MCDVLLLLVYIRTCLLSLYECIFMPLVLSAMKKIDRLAPDTSNSSVVPAEQLINCEQNHKTAYFYFLPP